MISVPQPVMVDYVAILRSREIPPADLEHYKKWLRYFYDFYSKYLDTNDKPEKIKLFLENKPPQELSTADVKEYLTHLAVKCKVAASTQNHAFCIGC